MSCGCKSAAQGCTDAEEGRAEDLRPNLCLQVPIGDIALQSHTAAGGSERQRTVHCCRCCCTVAVRVAVTDPIVRSPVVEAGVVLDGLLLVSNDPLLLLLRAHGTVGHRFERLGLTAEADLARVGAVVHHNHRTLWRAHGAGSERRQGRTVIGTRRRTAIMNAGLLGRTRRCVVGGGLFVCMRRYDPWILLDRVPSPCYRVQHALSRHSGECCIQPSENGMARSPCDLRASLSQCSAGPTAGAPPPPTHGRTLLEPLGTRAERGRPWRRQDTTRIHPSTHASS